MAKRGGFPGGMPGNMNNIMKQAQKMQKQMEEAQKALEEQEITAKAGGGAVEVTVSGKHEVTKVKLSEEVVDPDDIEMLEDLIMAATNEVAAVHLSVEHDTEACALNLAFVELAGKRREEVINFLYSVAVDEGLGFSHHRHDVAYCLHVFICEYIYINNVCLMFCVFR